MAEEALTPDSLKYIFEELDKGTMFADIVTALADVVDSTYLAALESELMFQWGKRTAYHSINGGDVYWRDAYWNVLTPAPTAVMPDTIDIAGGEVVIFGSLFPPGCTVTVDGEECEVLAVSSGAIHCIVPAHAAENDLDIVVTAPNTNAGTLSGAFHYAKVTPAFTSITPASGPAEGGTECRIVGTDFTPGMTVTIGGHACTVLAQGPTFIDIRTPAHAAGALDVVITAVNADADTATGGFTYV